MQINLKKPVADPGGGVQGVRTPPLLSHDVGFLTLGPKLDPPPFFACRPKMDPSGGSRVCVSDRGDHPAPPWNVDDVTFQGGGGHRGGVLVNVQGWGCFSNFLRADDVTRTMSKGDACEKSCIRAWTPFKNPGSAPEKL